MMLDGSPSSVFKSSHGIWQDNPISPFLFILATKGLRCTINALVAQGKIKGLRHYGNDLPISHQQFANDTMLMGVPIEREARALKLILEDFMEALGTSIKAGKSQIYFYNTDLAVQGHLAGLLGF